MSGSGNTRKAIRDTQRLLKRENLPADVRQEKERKLKALLLLADEDHRCVEGAPSSIQKRTQPPTKTTLQERYKLVKFLEKKKVIRKIKQLVAVASRQQNLPQDTFLQRYFSQIDAPQSADNAVFAQLDNLRAQVNYITVSGRMTVYYC